MVGIQRLPKSKVVTTKEFDGEHLDLSNADFSVMDNHARACPAEEEESIARLSWYLTSPFLGDQVAQLRSIFAWMAANITYDYASLVPGQRKDQGPESVLRNKVAVCAGFANLYDDIARYANLGVRQTGGLARGAGYVIGADKVGGEHAWNVVNINGEELFIDSTWGSGHRDDTGVYHQVLNPWWFLLSPKRMIYTHFPDKPSEQFLDPPISKDAFRRLPSRHEASWTLGIRPTISTNTIRTRDDYFETQIRFKKEEAMKRMILGGRVMWEGSPEPLPTACHWTRDEGKYYIMTIKGFCPGPGSGKLVIFANQLGDLARCDQASHAGKHALSYQIVNDGSGANFQPLVAEYPVPGFSSSVLEPLTAQVQSGRQKVRVLVYDVEHGVRPALVVLKDQNVSSPEPMREVEPGVFELDKALVAGEYWIAQRFDMQYRLVGRFSAV
ncbi:hypothetical protein BG005_007482 [Podila minutissima]|nr:hypothetical protein BG005_007482 [Podila minutissima]